MRRIGGVGGATGAGRGRNYFEGETAVRRIQRVSAAVCGRDVASRRWNIMVYLLPGVR